MKEILISASVLIGLVLLLRLILRGKVRQKLLYAAWLLVALRLLVPIQFGQWSFSLNTLTQTVTEQSETFQYAEEIIQSPVVDPFYQVLYEDLEQEYQDKGMDTENPDVKLEIEKQLPKTAPTLSQILKTVWLAGTGVMALWFLLTNLSFRRKAKAGAVPLETDAPVSVRVSSSVSTPCLVGLVRPVIYVTPECTADPQMLRHVLTHETAHLRQWDPVWSLVRCVCLCIYWFNPLVWVAAAQSRRDCELSCDESALRQLGDEERTAYGRTLLTMVRSASAATLLNTATSMSESKKQLKERMCFIVKKPRNIVIAAIAMTLVIALAAGCAFTGGKQSEETPPETEPTTTEPTTEPITQPTTQPQNNERLYPVNPVPEGLVPLVVRDGVFYTKDVKVTRENVGYWKCPLALQHSVRIPQLSVDTENATEFNKKIWRKHSDCLWELSEDREGSSVYWCDYQWDNQDGIVGILVYYDRGEQGVNSNASVDGYYYDMNQDRELTFEEYLAANGTTYDQVLEIVLNSEEYQKVGETDKILLDCLFFGGKPIAILRNYTADPGWKVVQLAYSGVGTEPVQPLKQSDFIQTEFKKNTAKKELVGKWIAHVKNNDSDAVSYILELKKDGTANYIWGGYGSERIESFKGTWKTGDEDGTFVLNLTSTGEGTAYDVTSIQRLRITKDGSAVQARWSGGTQLFQFYSESSLVMYRYDDDRIYYDIPLIDLT